MTISHATLSAADGIDIPVEINVRHIRSRYRITVSEKGARLAISPSLAMESGKILRKHASWIGKHYLSLKDSVLDPNLSDGSEILFKGERMRLGISEGENSVSYDSENDVLQFCVPRNGREDIRDRLRLWYLSQSANFAKILAARWCVSGKFKIDKLVLKDMSTRWGTCCSRRKIITLNWRLILAPDGIYEYVLLHELAHLKVPGHGREFWNYMETILPGASIKRSWLNKNGYPILRFLSERRLSPERIM
ncbi:MAG: YgjP-like metallopeptidase domain-containing protein [Victivallales bacterium]